MFAQIGIIIIIYISLVGRKGTVHSPGNILFISVTRLEKYVENDLLP